MRKSISLSALLSSLLATPLIAAPPIRQQDVTSAAPAATPTIVAESPNAREALAADARAKLDEHLQLLLKGYPLDAHGMQGLHRELNADMQQHLEGIRAFQNSARLNGTRLFPTQFAPDSRSRPVFAARTEKAAFLGVSTSPVGTILHEQLDIPRGMGLIIDLIEKDSPAAAAGLKVHDILQKLDDQLLVNPQQLAVLVRSKKPGDSLSITLLRGGKQTTISAKLGEKELPLLEDLQEPGMFTNPNMVPLNPLRLPDAQEYLVPPHSSRISVNVDKDGNQTRKLVDDQHEISLSTMPDGTAALVVRDRAGRLIYEGPADKADLARDVHAKVDDLKKKSSAFTFRNDGKGPVESRSETMMLSRADGDHLITLHIDGHNRTLIVKDVKAGKTLFDGLANTDDDLKSLPAEIREKVKALDAKAKSDRRKETDRISPADHL